jgi:hypothetical protein
MKEDLDSDGDEEAVGGVSSSALVVMVAVVAVSGKWALIKVYSPTILTFNIIISRIQRFGFRFP